MKKTLLSFFIIIFIAGAAKFYFRKNSSAKLEQINIVSPSSSAAANGIVKLSAKFLGNPSDVSFTLKNDKDEKIKSGNGFFESDSGEWVYYLNSMEVADGKYRLTADASLSNKDFHASQDIKIDNAGESSSAKLASAIIPPAVSPPPAKNKTAESPVKNGEPKKNDAQKENPPQTDKNKISDTVTQSNENLPDEILNGVIKALSGVYDAINNNLLAENLTLGYPAPSETAPQGKVAGATVEKEPEKSDKAVEEPKKQEEAEKEEVKKNGGDDYGWFRYDLKISNIENKEVIASEKILNAKCNNPLDSVEFILDNLDTPDIDYTFNGVNNYGYYTYWTYKLNPKDIKKGEYLLYAKGTIDWHTYESPIIVIRIE